jgi:hypothetical protein
VAPDEEDLTATESTAKARRKGRGQRWPRSTTLHEDPMWRSALEVVVQHEISEFHDVPIFHYLIKDKWDKFARDHYVKYALVPYALFVVVATIAIQERCVVIWGDVAEEGKSLEFDNNLLATLDVIMYLNPCPI